VKYLVETFGEDSMTSLLLELQQGHTVDDALVTIYGFDVDGLEDRWRIAIRAAARAPVGQPTAVPSPTYVPTIQPVSIAPASTHSAPAVILTSRPTQALPDRQAGSPPPIGLTLGLIGVGCVLLLVIGVAVVGLVVRRESGSGRQR
jgi:hypothetical protein